MNKEIKNSLPFYKISYAVFFIVVLSLIRGVSSASQIGAVLEAPMAILAAVFCADTYVREIVSKRSEIQRLYPMKKRTCFIVRRMIIQEVFLLLLAVIGYGLFLVFQNPSMYDIGQEGMGKEFRQFFVYLVSIMITLGFWGLLSNTFACFFRNIWGGIGGCLVIWIITNSNMGEEYFGSWNLFSYTFRNIENDKDFSWMCGKVICIGFCFIMLWMLPKILKKRG